MARGVLFERKRSPMSKSGRVEEGSCRWRRYGGGGGGRGVAGTCHFEERRGGEGMDLYIGAATIFPN